MKVEKIFHCRLELTAKELRLLNQCLNYCFHRLTQHHDTGLEKVVNAEWVDHRRKLIAKEIGW